MDKAMLHTLKVYLLLLPLFFLIDYLWLGQVMVGFYKQELGPLARKAGEDLNPLIWAAIVVYLFIPLGIVLFALPLGPVIRRLGFCLWRHLVRHL